MVNRETAEQPRPRRKQERGLRTRSALIAATVQVVADAGYAKATTKAIADAAGVAEGTIYRHFAAKHDLFFAAVLDLHADLIESVTQLPELAGTGSVHENLGLAIRRLAALRSDLLPLEVWMLGQPEVRNARLALMSSSADSAAFGPARTIADYLAAEQSLGRVRSDLDPSAAAQTILAALFGIAFLPASDDPDRYDHLVSDTIDLLVHGLTAATLLTD